MSRNGVGTWLLTTRIICSGVTPLAVSAATSVPQHQAHVGTVADCGANGILWHFVLNQLDAGTASGTVTATFASAGAKSDAGEPVGNGKVQHFWIATGSADLLTAFGVGLFTRGLEDDSEALQRAAAKDPAQPEIHEHLGDALYASGRRYEARFAWAAALVTAEEDIAARVRLKLDSGLTPATAAP